MWTGEVDRPAISVTLGRASSEGAEVPISLVAALIRRGDSKETQRAYSVDLTTFRRWLVGEGLAWDAVSVDDLDRYREWLAVQFARATVNRRLVVVRSLYAEAKRRHAIAEDPASRLRSLRGRDDRDGGALTRQQAREVLDAIAADLERHSHALLARRDMAIVSLLLRTGLRRSELASLTVSSMGAAQGHRVITLVGKGNVSRSAKLPPDVARTLDEWIESAREAGRELSGDDPLFVEVRKGGILTFKGSLSDRAVYGVVERRCRAVGVVGVGPHALRATFVTLALEGGAPLHLVQHAAGHADPRTTERYWRRRDALDHNAVDYVRI
jgi:integrase